MVIGAIVVVAIAAVGIGAFIRASKAPAKPVVLRCEYVGSDGPCAHVYSQHEDNGGPCHGQVKKMGPSGVMDWEPCRCPGYSGPVPAGM